LHQYAETFRLVFTLPQFRHFVTVLLGFILTPERRTLTGLLSRVAGVHSLSVLSRFFSQAPWSPQELAHTWLKHFRQQLTPQVQAEHQRQQAHRPPKRGRPKDTQVTAFLIPSAKLRTGFDDTTIGKHIQGKPGLSMVGVGHHYSTTAGGIVEGHSLVVGLLELLGRRCPLPPMLYRQKEVAEAEEVPFQSKVDLVVEAVEALTALPGTKTHILVDSWYTCHRLWRACLKRSFAITGGLKVNRWLRLSDPQQPGQWQKVRLSSYIAQLKPQDFVSVPWRGRWVAAHLVPTLVYKLGACQVLVVKESSEAPPESARCWATSDLKAEVVTVASYAAQRWDIETFIADAKGLLGLDHYQVTSTEGVVRFCHMVCCCYLYLDEMRARLVAQVRRGPP
jgi:SRSO17 transposase